jgi:hypothetical protein
MDQQLPAQILHAVPHVTFSIFNFSIPTIVAFVAIVLVFFAGAWLRIPNFIAGPHDGGRDTEPPRPESGEAR